jgi:NitT/TauT family transport system substrate-binding protein
MAGALPAGCRVQQRDAGEISPEIVATGRILMFGVKNYLLAGIFATAAVTSAGPAVAQQKIKMMYTAMNGFSAAYVAQEQGFFKKHSIDVEFVLTPSSGNNPPALVSGSVQVAGPTMTTLLQANDAGLDLVVIAGGAVYPLPGDVLIARTGSDIRKPTDLKGKMVGVPGLGALLHVMLRRHLKENGVDPNEVRYSEVGFVQAADALKTGQIDAYPSQAPFTARILQSGAGYEVADWLKNTPDGTLTVVYATTRKWAMENKQLVNALQAAMQEAKDYIPTHADELNKAVGIYTKLPAAVVASLPPSNLTVDVSPEQIKWWIDIVKEQDLIKGNPDPKSIIFK